MTLFELLKRLDSVITKKQVSQFMAGLMDDAHIMFKYKWETEYKPLKSEEELDFEKQDFLVVEGSVPYHPVSENPELHKLAYVFFSEMEQEIEQKLDEIYGSTDQKNGEQLH